MQVSPTISAVINIAIAVLGVVGTLTAELTTLFGSGNAQAIVSIAGVAASVIGIVNGALHGVSSAKAGPLVPEQPK